MIEFPTKSNKRGAPPLEAQYLYRQGLFLSQEGKKEQAVRSLRMAAILAPRFSEAYNAMGNCFDELGQPDEAIRNYERVLSIDPGHQGAKFKLELMRGKRARVSAGPATAPLRGARDTQEDAGTTGTRPDVKQFLRCLVFLPEMG